MLLKLPNNTMYESILQSPLLHSKDMILNLKRDDASDMALCEIREGGGKSDDGILVEQAEALGKQFNYDSSVLTLKQRQALFKKYWAMHLKLINL